MAGTVRARVKRGMLELLEKIDLPEGKEVSVTILETPRPEVGTACGALQAPGKASLMQTSSSRISMPTG